MYAYFAVAFKFPELFSRELDATMNMNDGYVRTWALFLTDRGKPQKLSVRMVDNSVDNRNE